MRILHLKTVGLIAVTVCLAASLAWAQAPVTATVDSSGLVSITSGGQQVATIDLNAHGPGWQHAPQQTATGEVSDLQGVTGKRVTGTLPIPNTEGGQLAFTETVRAVSQGLRLEYDLSVSQAVRVNGLQLSLNLPVDVHAGGEVMILHPHYDPEIAGLPTEHTEGGGRLWSGSGSTVEIAEDTEHAITVELRAATDVLVQDLREWDETVFEVRFPAIMEGGGREITPDDRFHLDLTVSFSGPLTLQSG